MQRLSFYQCVAYHAILPNSREIPGIKRYRILPMLPQNSMYRASYAYTVSSAFPSFKQAYMLPNPPNSKAIRPPGLSSHFIPSITPAGSSLHQCSVAEVKIASNDPLSFGSKVDDSLCMSAWMSCTPGRIDLAFSS